MLRVFGYSAKLLKLPKPVQARLEDGSGLIAKKKWKISAQLWQQTDQHILELGNECKWQVFLDRFRRYGVGLAIFARGNLFGNMDAAMLVVHQRGPMGSCLQFAKDPREQCVVILW